MKTPHAVKAFSVFSFTSMLIILGAFPASAATLAPTATAPGIIDSTGTNAFPITVTATSVTGAPANMFNIDLPQGWTFVTPEASCNGIVITGISGTLNCQKINFGGTNGFATLQSPAGAYSTGQVMSATFAANTLNVSSSRVFTVNLADSFTGGTNIDSGQATLAGGAPVPPPAPSPEPEVEKELANTGMSNSVSIGISFAAILLISGVAMVALKRRQA